ncbi:MAG: SusC/RagA family TonB-linked outer membrane protein, partial [Cytophagaceae bacterium]|nr:SusC/RagA family TonB-linked outer membrane protein [Cytophagaceae bacterium]
MKFKLLMFYIFCPAVFVWGQNIDISGVVTSADDGVPLPGVSIQVEGTQQGAITDFDGNYTLQNVAAEGTLVFSYIGFTTQRVNVNNQSTINVVLAADAQQLSDVIVTGYARERKVDLTGAISVVEMAPIREASMSSGSPIQA